MKIAISADGNQIESKIDQRFGRCKYFIIAKINEKEIESFEAVENQGAIQGHGAGIKAAEQIGNLNIEAVITGQIGPNATNVLNQLNIKTYSASGSVKDAIDDFLNNKLEKIAKIAKPHSQEEVEKTEKNEEKIFFPLLDNNGLKSEISQHFGHAPFFGVYNVQTKELEIIENNLDHTDPTKSPIDQIEEVVNPTTIFAKGIGGRAIQIIQEKGLILKTGNYTTISEVIENLDKLKDQTESCGHEHN